MASIGSCLMHQCNKGSFELFALALAFKLSHDIVIKIVTLVMGHSLTRTAHSFACSEIAHDDARLTALTRLLARLLSTHSVRNSWDIGKFSSIFQGVLSR